MSFTVYVNDEPVDLGPSFDVLRRFSEMGKLDPSDTYAALMGMTDASGEDLDPEYVTKVRDEAGRFQATFADSLTPELRQFLGTLTVLAPDMHRNGKSVTLSWKRTYVHPYRREGNPVAGYWREGSGNVGPKIGRDEFVRLLDALPAGTKFTLKPENPNHPLRGTWEKVDHAGLPYWYNRSRGLHRASGDFHATVARQVLDELELHRKPKDREYLRSKRTDDFFTSLDVLVERGTIPSETGFRPGVLLTREIDRAKQAIDGVHRVHLVAEPPPKVGLVATNGVTLGSYAYDDSGQVASPHYIRISPMQEFTEATFVHEWGHYLDQQILGNRENFGSRQATGLGGYGNAKFEHPLRPIMDAIAYSETTKFLMKLLTTDVRFKVQIAGESREISSQDDDFRQHTRYLLQPEEMFARAYTQWVGERSGSERLMGSVRKRRSSAGAFYPLHWEENEFEPIAAAFDKVFGALGWTEETKSVARSYPREGMPERTLDLDTVRAIEGFRDPLFGGDLVRLVRGRREPLITDPETIWGDAYEATPASGTKDANFEQQHPRGFGGKFRKVSDFFQHIGFPALTVGGAVRDPLFGKTPKDEDFVVPGMGPQQIKERLVQHGRTEDLVVADRTVGVRFYPSYEGAPPEGVEVVPPRIERSTGPGRHDFVIEADPNASLRDDAVRRDFTINALYQHDGPKIYHGTRRSDAQIEKEGFVPGPGGIIYATSMEGEARGYAGSGGRIVPVHVALNNPLVVPEGQPLGDLLRQHGIERLDGSHQSEQEISSKLKAEGYDGIVQHLAADVRDPSDVYPARTVYRIFNPDAINATNADGVIDPLGTGVSDAENRVLRATSPTSFYEDPLRMVRGARFVSQLDLTPDEQTLQQFRDYAPQISEVSGERIGGGLGANGMGELSKLLMGANPAKALRLGRDTGLLQALIPEYKQVIGYSGQSRYHDNSVDEHIFQAVQRAADAGAPLEVRLALLFHDLGKPESAYLDQNGKLRFNGNPEFGKQDHQETGARIASDVLTRLRYPVRLRDRVVYLVRNHMVDARPEASRLAAREFLARHGDMSGHLLAHRRADLTGKHPVKPDLMNEVENLNRLEQMIREQEHMPTKISDLAINGDDLIDIGFQPGPALGAALGDLLREVILNPELNTRDALLSMARARMTQYTDEPRRTVKGTRAEVKARGRVHVRPYLREGRPVAGYEQTRELVGELLRGVRAGGKGKGRKGLKRNRKGWLEYAQQARETPPLDQDELLRRRDAATRYRSDPWHVTESGEPGLEKGDWRLIDNGLGYDVYVGDEHRGWVKFDPSRSAQEAFEQVVPYEATEQGRFLDDWFGGPGRPGRYQWISGDPGTAFEEQHERIMETGARVDAELSYRTRAEEKTWRDLKKRVDAVNRKRLRLAKEADKVQFEVTAEILEREYDWERRTPDEVKRRYRTYMKASAKLSATSTQQPTFRDRQVMSANVDVYWAHHKAQFDPRIRELDDQRIALIDDRPDAELRAAYEAFFLARRDVVFDLLGKVRDFGGDLGYERMMGYEDDADARMAQNAVERAAGRWLPTEWIDASNDAPWLLLVNYAPRGKYIHETLTKNALLLISKSQARRDLREGEAVAAHELVHRAERTRVGLRGAQWTFYTSRVSPGTNRAWEEPQKLRDLTGVSSFEDNERARSDEFVSAYSGKTYGDNMDSPYEILTMGIEDIVGGTHGVLASDQEYRQFILGVLAVL